MPRIPPALAVIADIEGSRILYMQDHRKYVQVIKILSDCIERKNSDLDVQLQCKYAIFGGDSFQGCLRKLKIGQRIEDLLPNPKFKNSIPYIYKGIGIGYMYHKSKDTHLCNGTHYIRALQAVEIAKISHKICEWDSIRFSVGCDLLDSLLDKSSLLISELYKHHYELSCRLSYLMVKLLNDIYEIKSKYSVLKRVKKNTILNSCNVKKIILTNSIKNTLFEIYNILVNVYNYLNIKYNYNEQTNSRLYTFLHLTLYCVSFLIQNKYIYIEVKVRIKDITKGGRKWQRKREPMRTRFLRG